MRTAFRLSGHRDVVAGLAFSADGALLASAGKDGFARVWDMRRRREMASFHGGERINGVALTPDGRTLLALPDSKPACVLLWVMPGGKAPVRIDNVHDSPARQLALAPDGSVFATAALNGEVKLWDTATQALRYTFDDLAGATPGGLAFSADGKYLAATTLADQFCLWVTARGKRRPTLEVPPHCTIRGVAIAPDGAYLALAQEDGTRQALQYDINGERRAGFSAPVCSCVSVAYSPCGKRLAIGGRGGEVLLLDAATGAEKARGNASGGPIHGLVFSPDGKRLAVASRAIDVFDVAGLLG